MTISQRVFDTAIVKKIQNNRCVGPSQAVAANTQFLITGDNELKCVVCINRDMVEMRSSSDNGFTWSTRDNEEDMQASIITTDKIYDGPYMTLTPKRDWNADDVVYRDNWVFIYSTHDSIWFQGQRTDAPLSVWGHYTNKFGSGSDTFGVDVGKALDGGYFASTGHGEEIFYTAYSDVAGKLVMIGQNFNNTNIAEVLQEYVEFGVPVVSGVIAVQSDEALVHTVAVLQFPADSMRYLIYNKAFGSNLSIDDADNGSWGSTYEIANVSGSAAGNSSYREPTIDADGLGNLCVNYYRVDAGSVCSGYYAISNDKGHSWKNIYNPPPAGYSGYYDSLTGLPAGSTDVLAGMSGFLISQIFDKDNSHDLFVKQIPSYVVDTTVSTDEWKKVNSIEGDVLAGKFFRYTNELRPTLGDKSGIRMAYQMGKANETNGFSSVTSTIYHEKLTNNAYPIEFTGTSYAGYYMNYYASGLIGELTTLYSEKVDSLGMYYSFTKYDPNPDSEVNGIGAYSSPVTSEYKACVDPGSYGFPSVAKNNTDFSEYIQRDSRKMFYKADTFLDRTFVMNKGGILKRTIWTIRIMGNDYEIAQIVPRWLDGKLIHYEANLYIVSPGNDPWSKIILPSET